MEGTSPSYQGTITQVVTIEAKKPKIPTLLIPRVNFRSYVNRLGEMLYYPCQDPLSENLMGWVVNTVSMVIDEKFEINKETKEILFKRVHKLVTKKLLSSLDAAPIKNPISLLHDPVLERDWIWEREILDDYLICWNIVNRKTPPVSPFDQEVMASPFDHEFGKAMCEWVKDLAKDMGYSFFVSNAPTAAEGGSSLAVKQQTYTEEEARLRLAFYDAYAKDANLRMYGREVEKNIKAEINMFDEVEMDSKERVAQVLAEAEELAEAHEEEMEKKFESLEQRHRRMVEELNSRISEEKEKNEQIFTKIRETISQEAEKVSERQKNHYALLQNELKTIEQTHLMAEEALDAQLAEGNRQIEQIKKENQSLSQSIDECHAQFHDAQLSFHRQMKQMIKAHQNRDAFLTLQIEKVQEKLNETKNKLDQANAVGAHQEREVAHLRAAFAHQQSLVVNLGKKAKKKKFLGVL